VADRENTVYVNAGTTICAIGLKEKNTPEAGLEVKRTLDTTKIFLQRDIRGQGSAVRFIGMGMTYDGYLIIGAFNAIAVVDRITPLCHTQS